MTHTAIDAADYQITPPEAIAAELGTPSPSDIDEKLDAAYESGYQEGKRAANNNRVTITGSAKAIAEFVDSIARRAVESLVTHEDEGEDSEDYFSD